MRNYHSSTRRKYPRLRKPDKLFISLHASKHKEPLQQRAYIVLSLWQDTVNQPLEIEHKIILQQNKFVLLDQPVQ